MSPNFGQAQKIELARLNQGLSQVEQDASNGVLSAPEAKTILQKIHARRTPLLKRQQQAEQQAQQQAKHQAMDAHALATAMEQQAAVARAQGLPDRVATYTDPLTGRSAHLLETKPGHVEELKFERAGEDEKALREAEAASNEPVEGPSDESV
jgi:hypothetical protein